MPLASHLQWFRSVWRPLPKHAKLAYFVARFWTQKRDHCMVPQTGPPRVMVSKTRPIFWAQSWGHKFCRFASQNWCTLRFFCNFCCNGVLQERRLACAAGPQKWFENGPVFGTTAPLQTPRCIPLSTPIGATFWYHFWDHASIQNGLPSSGHQASQKWHDKRQQPAVVLFGRPLETCVLQSTWAATQNDMDRCGWVAFLSEGRLRVHIDGGPHYPRRPAQILGDKSGSEPII